LAGPIKTSAKPTVGLAYWDGLDCAVQLWVCNSGKAISLPPIDIRLNLSM
jgi:hypothetical protein